MKLFDPLSLLKAGLILLFLSLMPLLEFLLILRLAEEIGRYLILAYLAVTGLGGLVLYYGLIKGILRQIHGSIREGLFPGEGFKNLCGAIAGALFLLMPGFVTDLIGLLAVVPFIRKAYGFLLYRPFRTAFEEGYQYLRLEF